MTALLAHIDARVGFEDAFLEETGGPPHGQVALMFTWTWFAGAWRREFAWRERARSVGGSVILGAPKAPRLAIDVVQ